MAKKIQNREELIRRLERDHKDFYVCDGTMEDIENLEYECKYDYDKIYSKMIILLDIMYSEE